MCVYKSITPHRANKPVTTVLTYPWKCTVLHCNHLGNTWKPLVLMTRHFDYCPSASKGDNQSARSSAPVVSRCFPGGYNVKLYISRGRLARWLLAFLYCAFHHNTSSQHPLSQIVRWVKLALKLPAIYKTSGEVEGSRARPIYFKCWNCIMSVQVVSF